MAIIHTFVRLTGGLVVSYFQYMSDSVLYKISIVEGDIEYVDNLTGNCTSLYLTILFCLS